MTTATQLPTEVLELLASFETGLQAGVELGALTDDKANDIINDVLLKYDMTPAMFYEQLETLC